MNVHHFALLTALCLGQLGSIHADVEKLEEIESIRMSLTFTMKGESVEGKVFKLHQDKMRLSISGNRAHQGVRLVYSETQIHRFLHDSFPLDKIESTGDEAPSDLFDLLSLTPDYHFSQSEEGTLFDLNIEMLEGYEIVLHRAPARSGDVAFRPAQIAQLLRRDLEGGESALIRSARFVEFDTFGGRLRSPSKIIFTDEISDEETVVEITAVDYNVGVTHFMFGLPSPRVER